MSPKTNNIKKTNVTDKVGAINNYKLKNENVRYSARVQQ